MALRTISIWIGFLFLLGMSASQGAMPLSAQESPMPIETYWTHMQQTLDVVTELPDSPSQTRKAQLAAEAERWEGVSQVQLADETIIPVDHTYLVAQLRADPPQVAYLEAMLTALLDASEQSSIVEPPEDAQETLARILARPQFNWPQETISPIRAWWDRLVRRFWEWVSRILPQGSELISQTSLLTYILTGLGVLILGAILAYVLRSLVTNVISEQAIDPDSEAGLAFLSADMALKQAQTHAGEGDYRTAVRYLYLSSLLLLEERGLLRYDRSLTNREYLQSVAHLPNLAALLREVVDVFDRVWYGYQTMDQAAYQQFAARVTELRQQR